MDKVIIVYCKNDKALVYNKDKDKNLIIGLEKLSRAVADRSFQLLNPNLLNQYLSDKAVMNSIRNGQKF